MSAGEHLRKIVASSVFHSSESLQRLLIYLGEHSLENPPQPVKEYQIATEVLGRGEQFDSRMDSGVRVCVARLRSKLLEYYATEGKDDPLRVEIPKGSYIILFRERDEPAPDEAAEAAGPRQPLQTPPPGSHAPPKHRPYAAVAAALAAGLTLGALTTYWFSSGGGGQHHKPSTALQSFWSAFTGPNANTIVVFSNARFVGDGETGLRYFNPEVDRLEDMRELHTGVGEVFGVYELSRVFQSLGAALEVKRSALVDWDAVKKSSVVFIGGPAENLPVRELGRATRFVFEPYVDSEGRRRVVVAERDSGAAQPRRFDAGAVSPARRDYAVIRLLPGLAPGRRILILAGITTLGTQAAVEFVSRPDTVRTLLSKLTQDGSKADAAFECVLEVSINGGVPVESILVALDVIPGDPAVLSSAE